MVEIKNKVNIPIASGDAFTPAGVTVNFWKSVLFMSSSLICVCAVDLPKPKRSAIWQTPTTARCKSMCAAVPSPRPQRCKSKPLCPTSSSMNITKGHSIPSAAPPASTITSLSTAFIRSRIYPESDRSQPPTLWRSATSSPSVSRSPICKSLAHGFDGSAAMPDISEEPMFSS